MLSLETLLYLSLILILLIRLMNAATELHSQNMVSVGYCNAVNYLFQDYCEYMRQNVSLIIKIMVAQSTRLL